jgi:hypothetical protein
MIARNFDSVNRKVKSNRVILVGRSYRYHIQCRVLDQHTGYIPTENLTASQWDVLLMVSLL